MKEKMSARSSSRLKRSENPIANNNVPSNSSKRVQKVIVKENQPCTILPHQFYLNNPGLICSNCSDFFGRSHDLNKTQDELDRRYQCFRLRPNPRSNKPLKISAVYLVSSGGSTRKRCANDDDTFEVDVVEMTSVRTTSSSQPSSSLSLDLYVTRPILIQQPPRPQLMRWHQLYRTYGIS